MLVRLPRSVLMLCLAVGTLGPAIGSEPSASKIVWSMSNGSIQTMNIGSGAISTPIAAPTRGDLLSCIRQNNLNCPDSIDHVFFDSTDNEILWIARFGDSAGKYWVQSVEANGGNRKNLFEFGSLIGVNFSTNHQYPVFSSKTSRFYFVSAQDKGSIYSVTKNGTDLHKVLTVACPIYVSKPQLAMDVQGDRLIVTVPLPRELEYRAAPWTDSPFAMNEPLPADYEECGTVLSVDLQSQIKSYLLRPQWDPVYPNRIVQNTTATGVRKLDFDSRTGKVWYLGYNQIYFLGPAAETWSLGASIGNGSMVGTFDFPRRRFLHFKWERSTMGHLTETQLWSTDLESDTHPPVDTLLARWDSDPNPDVHISQTNGRALAIMDYGSYIYVALGDSFSAGTGARSDSSIADYFDGQYENCFRSRKAYSQLTFLPPPDVTLERHFFACHGALTVDILSNSRNGEPPQAERPELALASLVTIGIGGNDIGFENIIRHCMTTARCEEFFEEASNPMRRRLTEKVENLRGRLVGPRGVFTTLKAKVASGTPIYVLGYPRLFALAGQEAERECADSARGVRYTVMGLSPTERDYLNRIADLLEKVLLESAVEAGLNYVSVMNAFEGHEICGREGRGQEWIHRVRYYTVSESIHPTIEGQRAYASALREKVAPLSSVVLGNEAEVFVAQVDVDSLSGLSKRPLNSQKQTAPSVRIGTYGDLEIEVDLASTPCRRPGGPVFDGQVIRFVGAGFMPGAPVTVKYQFELNGLHQNIVTVEARFDGLLDVYAQVPTGRRDQIVSFYAVGHDVEGMELMRGSLVMQVSDPLDQKSCDFREIDGSRFLVTADSPPAPPSSPTVDGGGGGGAVGIEFWLPLLFLTVLLRKSTGKALVRGRPKAWFTKCR